MKTRIHIILIITLALYSCNSNPETLIDNAKKIAGEILEVEDLFLGSPSELIIKDSILLICDRFENRLLTLVDIKNNRFIGRIITEGRGPGEAIPPLRMSFWGNNLNAFQPQAGRLNIYDGDLNFYKQISFSDHTENIKQMRDSFIGIGIFEQGHFHIYNADGEMISKAGEFPYGGEKMDPVARFILYQGCLTSSKDGRYFSYGYAYSDILEFYELKGSEAMLLKKHGEKDVKGKYTNRLELDNDCLMGYKGAYGGDKYCYTLYLGKTFEENKHNKYWAANIIVFDWKGNHVKSYKLNVPILSFCVDEKNETIYGLSRKDDEYVIMKFKM